MDKEQLNGIHPDVLYRESDLRRVVEVSALRRAKRRGLTWHRFGRNVWILGSDLIRFLTAAERPDKDDEGE